MRESESLVARDPATRGAATRMRVMRVLEPLVLVATPVAAAFIALSQVQGTALLTLALVIGAILFVTLGVERSEPRLRQIMPVVVLAAVAAVGRMLFAPIPDVKPVTAIIIVAGTALGARAGFSVGALAALVSNFYFGQGAWTPLQMYAWGLVGYLAGVLAQCGVLGGCARCAPTASSRRSSTAASSTAGTSWDSFGRSRGKARSLPMARDFRLTCCMARPRWHFCSPSGSRGPGRSGALLPNTASRFCGGVLLDRR